MKVKVLAFALTTGLTAGLGLFLITWWMIITTGGSGQATVIGAVLRGYNLSPIGSLIGFIWAFAAGFIGGALFASIYNKLAQSSDD